MLFSMSNQTLTDIFSFSIYSLQLQNYETHHEIKYSNIRYIHC